MNARTGVRRLRNMYMQEDWRANQWQKEKSAWQKEFYERLDEIDVEEIFRKRVF